MAIALVGRLVGGFGRVVARGGRVGRRDSSGPLGDPFDNVGPEVARALSNLKMDVRVTGLDQAKAMLSNASAEVRRAAARALTDTAYDVRRAVPAGLRRSLDRPTPFTANENAMFIRRANPQQLEAFALFKDRQASYLRYQVEGGVRRPSGRGLKLPSAIRLDAFGNIPRGAIKQLIAVARKEGKLGKRRARTIAVSRNVDLFYGDPRDLGGRNFPPGIYKVVKAGDRSSLIPLVVFPETTASYRKRVDLRAIAAPVVASEFPARFRRHYNPRGGR